MGSSWLSLLRVRVIVVVKAIFRPRINAVAYPHYNYAHVATSISSSVSVFVRASMNNCTEAIGPTVMKLGRWVEGTPGQKKMVFSWMGVSLLPSYWTFFV